MPRRHRRSLPTPEAEPYTIPTVTEEDYKNFGSFALWAARYVNHVYEHAGEEGKPLRKIWNEAVYWQRHEGAVERLMVSAKGLFGVEYPSLGSSNDDYVEYKRQLKLGTELDVEKRTHPDPDERIRIESLTLQIDADDVVIGGSYHWQGGEVHGRPAPFTDFDNIDDAHTKGLSASAVSLLNEFRDFTLEDGVGDRVSSGLWIGDRSAFIVPEALVPLPEFV